MNTPASTKVEQLLPCPFCGGEAALTGTNMYRAGQPKKLAVCRDCGACADADLWNTRATLTHAPSGEGRELIADAIREADASFGYSYRLTKLVDGVEEHTLFMNGYEPAVFEDRDEGYRLIEQRRNKVRADAILATLYPDPRGKGREASEILAEARIECADLFGDRCSEQTAICAISKALSEAMKIGKAYSGEISWPLLAPHKDTSHDD